MKEDKHEQQEMEETDNKNNIAGEKTVDKGVTTGELPKTTEAVAQDERTGANSANEKSKGKKILSMHAIKCKCGNILSRRVEHCPECGKNVEALLEELRQDFYRINFTHKNDK